MENYSSEVKLSDSELRQLCKSIIDDAGTIMCAHKYIQRKIIHVSRLFHETKLEEFKQMIDQWIEIQNYFLENQQTFKIRI